MQADKTNQKMHPTIFCFKYLRKVQTKTIFCFVFISESLNLICN